VTYSRSVGSSTNKTDCHNINIVESGVNTIALIYWEGIDQSITILHIGRDGISLFPNHKL
jgi:hypothetical protein